MKFVIGYFYNDLFLYYFSKISFNDAVTEKQSLRFDQIKNQSSYDINLCRKIEVKYAHASVKKLEPYWIEAAKTDETLHQVAANCAT